MGGSTSGGSTSPQTVTTQTTTQDPWSGAQPYLTSGMAAAQSLYGSGTGYEPYPGQTLASVSPYTVQGLNNLATIANQQLGGSPELTAARTFAGGLQNTGGLSPTGTEAVGWLRQALPNYQQLYGEAQGQQNPYLQAIIEANNQKIQNRVASSMSGAGRYGSGQYTDVMARALAESANPLLAQDYARRQAQRMQATQGLQQLGATLAQTGATGTAQALQAAQMIPNLDLARYMGSQKLQELGQFWTARDQAGIDKAVQYWNAVSARPWEQLARYNAIISGTGGLGGTTVTSAPAPVQASLWQRALGGALAGGGLGTSFGLPGAAVGGLAGGLLGLL